MRYWQLVLVLLLFGGLVGCDHATKQLAIEHLRGQEPASLVRGVVELTYTENRDMGFSLLGSVTTPETRYPFLVGAKVVGILAAFGFLVARWRRSPWIEKAGLAAIGAGALGNLIDRVVRGFVVDFIHVSYWPVFNVADGAVVVGVALVLWAAHGIPSAPRALQADSA